VVEDDEVLLVQQVVQLHKEVQVETLDEPEVLLYQLDEVVRLVRDELLQQHRQYDE